jgi:signal transduction histidine kinase
LLQAIRQTNPQIVIKRITYTSCAIAFIIPLLAMIGWHFDLPILKSFALKQVPMNPTTALILLLEASALAILISEISQVPKSISNLIGKILASVACFIVSIKFSSYFGLDFGVDQLLFSQKLDSNIILPPNRMAPNTAFSLLLISISLLIRDLRQRWIILIFQACIYLTAFASLLVLIGYSYNSKDFIQVSYFLPMAFNTALAIFILAAGVLSSRSDIFYVETLMSSGPGGIMGRRLLPAVIGIPIIFGWLKIMGEKRALYDMEFGTALTIAMVMIVLAIIIGWTAQALNESEERLQKVLAEVKALNQILGQQNIKLQAVNEELEAFSSSVAHDLRAPLRAMTGFGHMLMTEHLDSLSENGKNLIQRVIQNGKKMGQLIESLMSLSRYSVQELMPVEVNLSQISTKILQELKNEVPSRSVEFRIQNDQKVFGDLPLLEAALTNLLSNAWKYSSLKIESVIEFGVKEEEGKRTFFVSDNGAGFDMKHSKKLFGAFQRLHSEKEFAGTGIGLATVKRIIHRHGGVIWAESKIGEGATFYFTL